MQGEALECEHALVFARNKRGINAIATHAMSPWLPFGLLFSLLQMTCTQGNSSSLRHMQTQAHIWKAIDRLTDARGGEMYLHQSSC